MPIENQKLVLILRGLPGVGKTYLANEYLKFIAERFTVFGKSGYEILSSDDYFMKGKAYEFDKELMQEAHKWNFDRFRTAIANGTPLIIIDNTNIKKFHYYHYLDYAQRNNYLVAVVTIPHNDMSNRELAARTIHGASSDTISRMRRNFEWEI